MAFGFDLSPAKLFLIAGLLQPAFLFLSLFGVAAAFRRKGLQPTLAIGAALVTIAVLGLMVFWLEWWRVHTHSIARIAAITAMLTFAGLTGLAIWRGQWRDEIAAPIALAQFATFFLLVWIHVGSDPSYTPLWVAANRWTHALPSDNSIPLQFARAIADGSVPKGQPSPYFGDWLSSDRPPLQTALLFLTPGHLAASGISEEVYQATAVALQMLVLIGAWTLSRALGTGRRMALLVMTAVFFTPLVLVNGAFVWPKLLAATFLLVAAAIHFSPIYFEVRHKASVGAMVGALGCLAMLSHGATAFALIGMGLASLALRRVGSTKYLLGAVIAFAVLYAPWLAYQRFVDPPADRLLKWHLAGVIQIDPRPFLQTLVESYRAESWNSLVAAREKNVEMLLDPGKSIFLSTIEAGRLFLLGQFDAAHAVLKQVRSSQFFLLIPGTGLIGLGLYLLPAGLFDSTTRPVALAIILTLAFWVLALFLPANAVIHHGSLFSEVALIVSVLAFISRGSAAAGVVCVAAQVALTAFQYAM